MTRYIYKVVDRDTWQAAVLRGTFAGAEIDLQDGYIHFSARHQVEETIRKHFAGRHNLLLLEVDAAAWNEGEDDSQTALRWEVSRNGEKFPHLYAALDVTLVTASYELPINAAGEHELPELSG
jgi:uncharacterized protein (DUF952 family)